MDKILNPILNRYSMYKVVSGSLIILFLISVGLSLVGELSYTPLAMVASLLVLWLSTWLTSLLCGLIFGIRIHHESSFITGAILFFIFTPTLEGSELAALVLVGLIAGASKFLLAYKGRHIFNPAAIAAFIVGIFGIAHATWWVGTPVLVVPTLILGFLVLQKTRRVPSSGKFLGFASVLVIAMLMVQGAGLSESLVLWLSWPILFFSSFMLTEPLTLPRKKWQQILEAAIVAVLFAIPIHIAGFETTPALALVIGNVLAFVFTRRQKVLLRFKERKQLTPTSHEYIFTPNKPQQFEAGQYIEIQVPSKKHDFRGSRRSFSLTSAPGATELSLGIKFYEPSSTFKQSLRQMPEGMVIESTGIGGDFTLPKDAKRPLLFVAGGIGITPFVSHLQSLREQVTMRDIIVFYSISSIDELAYKDILETSGVKVFVVTQSDTPLALPGGWTHINARYFTKEMFAENVGHIANRKAYISGPPLMIDGAKQQLHQLGVRRIKTDYFIGY